VIAGTASGVGKTSLALGLVRAWVRQGLRVQTFKVGPDFLDPTYLARASGRTCYNLDSWMSSPDHVRQCFARATADAELAVIEGVMGLFDGASPAALEGSTAEIALLLDAPVVLVAGAHGAARSLAATVKGFADFEPGLRVAGVIANQAGSSRHRAWLAEALAGAKLPPLLGAVPRDALAPLQSRHLGLLTADQNNLDERTLESLADACMEHVDMKALMQLAKNLPSPFGRGAGGEGACPARPDAVARRVRLGIARDEAFHFYYPDNLEALERGGAELAAFSPLEDNALPDDLDALYLGGGYPEVYAARLSANGPMLEAVRRFAESGRCVYAECGGLMYLGRRLKTLEGRQFPLAGVLPVETTMLANLKTLGYAEVTLRGDSLWGAAGDSCRGHEFHYSDLVVDGSLTDGWRPAYAVRRRRGEPDAAEGFAKGRVLASYVHLHWAARPPAVAHFLACCYEGRAGR
jgi:cobyrinic acid a,c-diamide synthase